MLNQERGKGLQIEGMEGKGKGSPSKGFHPSVVAEGLDMLSMHTVARGQWMGDWFCLFVFSKKCLPIITGQGQTSREPQTIIIITLNRPPSIKNKDRYYYFLL